MIINNKIIIIKIMDDGEKTTTKHILQTASL